MAGLVSHSTVHSSSGVTLWCYEARIFGPTIFGGVSRTVFVTMISQRANGDCNGRFSTFGGGGRVCRSGLPRCVSGVSSFRSCGDPTISLKSEQANPTTDLGGLAAAITDCSCRSVLVFMARRFTTGGVTNRFICSRPKINVKGFRLTQHL